MSGSGGDLDSLVSIQGASGGSTVASTSNSDFCVADGLHSGGTNGNLSIPTANTAVEAKVGGSRLANRKSLIITALDDLFWGYSNSVTSSNGIPIKKNQFVAFDIDANASSFQVWLVGTSNSLNARIAESP